MVDWKNSVQLAYLQTIIYTLEWAVGTKNWKGVKRDKDWENETEPKVSLYMLP